MKTLRDYQKAAVDSVYNHLRTRDDNPCVVIPTGGGKTPVLAQICMDAVNWSGRVLVLAHVKELLEQSVRHLHDADQTLISKVGVYSAGLGKREIGHPITVAGIQSVYEKATKLGRLDLIIVDEAHLIPIEGEGMYRTFLRDAKLVNPAVRVIGLTATPYRMKEGMICAPENILNHVCHETGVRELIARGYLCNLKSKAGSTHVDTDGLHIRAGEFVQSEIENLMGTEELASAAVADIVRAVEVAGRKAVLIFAASVEHGKLLAQKLVPHGTVGQVYGDTPSEERAKLVADFREGRLRFLVNMNVLTIGFDAPNVDMICLLRPTASPGLYYQMVGRGFRIHPGKEHCLILDYGNNVLRHGPVDLLKPEKKTSGTDGLPPAKECPQCQSLIHAAYRVCPECGFEFPPPEKKHRATHGQEAVLSGDVLTQDLEIEEVFYSVHTKRGDPSAPKTMRVTYKPVGLNADMVSEWVCVAHPDGTFPLRKAHMWWRARSNVVCPRTADEAVELAQDGALAGVSRIKVQYVPGEKFARIVSTELEAIPDYESSAAKAADLDAQEAPPF